MNTTSGGEEKKHEYRLRRRKKHEYHLRSGRNMNTATGS